MLHYGPLVLQFSTQQYLLQKRSRGTILRKNYRLLPTDVSLFLRRVVSEFIFLFFCCFCTCVLFVSLCLRQSSKHAPESQTCIFCAAERQEQSAQQKNRCQKILSVGENFIFCQEKIIFVFYFQSSTWPSSDRSGRKSSSSSSELFQSSI